MRQYLSDAIDDYMSLRSSQDLGKSTIATERGVLKMFLDVNGNVWTHNICERHTIRHFERASKTRQSQSLRLDHTYLTNFFEWARRTHRMPMSMDPMAGRRRPKGFTRARLRVPVTDFPRLLQTAGEHSPRDRMAVALFIYLLVRDSEARDIRVGDVDLDSGYVRVIVTKTRVEDSMPITRELDSELRLWLTHYSEAIGRPLHHNDYLVPGVDLTTMSRDEVTGRISGRQYAYVADRKSARLLDVVKRTLVAVGIPLTDPQGRPLNEGAHTLRRSGARALFDRLASDGYDRSLRLVQSMLHHSSVSMTEHYLGVTADQRSRDEILRGQYMYIVPSENVISLTGSLQ